MIDLAAGRALPSIWKNREYMLLWSGQVASNLGSSATTVVYPLLILALTDSPKAAGFAAALRAIPFLVLSLPVGALIDRWDRRRVMMLSNVGRAIAVSGLVLAMWLDVLTVAQIYVTVLVEGTLFVFFNIAEVAALPRVVPAAQLPEATAQNEAGYGVANIVGPTLGTLLYQSLSRAAPFVLDVVTYCVSVATLAKIRTPLQTHQASNPDRHLVREILEGLGWLWNQSLVRFMALLTGGLNVINAALPLLIIVAGKELGAKDAEIGLVFSIAGFGGIVGAIVGGKVRRRFSFPGVIIGTVCINAAVFPLLAFAPSYLVLGILASIMLFTMPVYNVVQFSYRLTLIPDALQGRVNSTFRLIAFGFMPAGAALCGLLIEMAGTTTTILVFGAWLAMLALATMLNPSLRAVPSGRP